MGTRAFIALGSNLGRREETILRALRTLEARGAANVVAASSLYESDAVGMGAAPAFVNAVAEVVPLLRPRDLLERMQAIEAELGRTGGHNQSRTIDLDLVAYGDEVSDAEGLSIPHPRFRERAFVLVPLSEIAPDFRDPRTHAPMGQLVAALADAASVRRVSSRRWIVQG
ncbi:MAG TPA: 2-amino-4-hydroxy-6-hydroxymethyldihydropteridine diphosphokinase [Candidatus Krumholzibacteria bacterium]|nr:2-amino-4-hydroxy-6-hydroxymethyldihydropteridine diphosphokinase [Candidatus Krumholzibacteria bacterium]